MALWTSGIADMRVLLNDNADSKLRWRKRVFGELNGVNKRYKTLEARRITDFTTAVLPSAVFLNGSPLAAVAISSDSVNFGEFILVTAPVDGDILEATYYIQWFLDTEIAQFLNSGANWIGIGSGTSTDYQDVPVQFRTAALKYGAADAYQMLALRWTDHLSMQYRVEDAPREEDEIIINAYLKAADMFRKEALKLRNDIYEGRQGAALAPIFATIGGTIRDVPPRS